MLAETAGGVVCAAAGSMAYAVRGKSSSLFGPSLYRGPADRRAIALTFDDGPSESTPELLEILQRYGVPATFFQCGANVRRLPQVAREVASAGHEIGNHADSHSPFCFRSRDFIYEELARSRDSIIAATACTPAFFRAPYGIRWFGLREAQRRLQLVGVMWTALGSDWRSDAASITARLLRKANNGAILCLHDGRQIQRRPDIRQTLEAVRRLAPILLARGFRLETVSELVGRARGHVLEKQP